MSLILGILLVVIAAVPAAIDSRLLMFFFPLELFASAYGLITAAATLLPILAAALIPLIRRVAQALIVLGGVANGVLVGIIFGGSSEAPSTHDWFMAVCLGLAAIAMVVLPFVPPLSWWARGSSTPPSGGPGHRPNPGAPGWNGGQFPPGPPPGPVAGPPMQPPPGPPPTQY
ncbi:hypothetical protein [Actinoalloteichus hymeniacidonis]|uniref:hypothetical protein n=1 Tax=Actinoalloteichus hymeniacidonis TaxID=340345 RepID=UPI0008533F92|nr:hypothetical protein [Actinoalloteichus hymeniacidonis]MBB5906155.1 hypothetical protein [Actinoalloteichus hymeniacidonis]